MNLPHQPDIVEEIGPEGERTARWLWEQIARAVNILDVANTRLITIVTKTAAYTATEADRWIPVNATSGAVVISLPPASRSTGLDFTVKKLDASANTVTVDPDGAEVIDDVATRVISAQYASVTFVSDGTKWWVV